MAPYDDVGSRSAMAAFVWLIAASVIALLLGLSYYFTSKNTKKKEKKPVTAAQLNQEAAARVAGGRRPRRMRVQRQEDTEAFNVENSDSDEGFDFEADKPEGKIGKKKQRKLEAKAEKRAERQALIEEREEKNRREQALQAEREKAEEIRQQKEKEQEEIERQRKEEQERREHEEYLKLKAEFTIEESGEVGILTEEESQAMLQEFIDYIKTSKVVLLEDLASHFNLKTQEVIERLENLQEMERITGVMDDRGKFIYISEEELRNVAKFIRQRGRISISDLAESSNTLIKLQEVENVTSVESVA